MARWEKDNWKSVSPDPEKVKCKDCFLREKDRYVDGKLSCKGSVLGFCQVYPNKPHDILFEGGDCDYYVDENEEDSED